MKDFKDKVVVITGGATGIGFSFAKRFGNEGAKVVIAARRQNRIDDAVAKLKSMGIEASGTACDVTKREDIEALADYAWNQYEEVHAIVNNAGVGPLMKSVIDATDEEIMSVLNINLMGVWHGVQVFGKRFREQGVASAIYNVGSENSLFDGVPMGGEYVVSKHGVLALTDILRKEVPDFIDVGLICPGLVNSELGDGGIQVGMDTDKYTDVAIQQIKAGKFYIVSHAYNMARIEERFGEMKTAFDTYAPRYENDVEFDVRTIFEKTSGH